MRKKPSFAIALRHEVRRQAAREMRKTLLRLRAMNAQVRALRLESSGYRRNLAGLERRLARVRQQGARPFPRLGAGRGRRMSGESIRSLRSRLRLSRAEFAKLVGVSAGSIFGWETGRTAPRRGSLGRVVQLRRMGVRAARAAVQGRRGRRRAVSAGRRRARRR